MPEFTNRPPRIQPELPYGDVTIPQPPASETGGRQQLIQVALPLITIIGYVDRQRQRAGTQYAAADPNGHVSGRFDHSGADRFHSQQPSGSGEEARLPASPDRAAQRDDRLARHPAWLLPAQLPGARRCCKLPETARTRSTACGCGSAHDRQRLRRVRLGIGTRPSTVRYALSTGSPAEDDPQQGRAQAARGTRASSPTCRSPSPCAATSSRKARQRRSARTTRKARVPTINPSHRFAWASPAMGGPRRIISSAR